VLVEGGKDVVETAGFHVAIVAPTVKDSGDLQP
jgi:hypothetical protein